MPHLLRALGSGLAGTIRRALRRRGRAVSPQADRRALTPVAAEAERDPTADLPQVDHRVLTHIAAEARRELIVWTLWMAAQDWDLRDTSKARLMFEVTLTELIGEVAPYVPVTPFGYGEMPTDQAYTAIQKAILRLVFLKWDDDPERIDDMPQVMAANDEVDAALNTYIAAATADM